MIETVQGQHAITGRFILVLRNETLSLSGRIHGVFQAKCVDCDERFEISGTITCGELTPGDATDSLVAAIIEHREKCAHVDVLAPKKVTVFRNVKDPDYFKIELVAGPVKWEERGSPRRVPS